MRGANAAFTQPGSPAPRGSSSSGDGRRAGGDQPALHRLVERHVGAPEPVDRLLGIADEEELAGRGRDALPVGVSAGSAAARSSRISACSGSVSWNSSTKMCVKRRCRSARTAAWSRTRSRARSSRSRKSSDADRALQLLVAIDHRPELRAEQRRPGRRRRRRRTSSSAASRRACARHASRLATPRRGSARMPDAAGSRCARAAGRRSAASSAVVVARPRRLAARDVADEAARRGQ